MELNEKLKSIDAGKVVDLVLFFFGGYIFGQKIGFGKGYGKGLKDAFTQKGSGFIHGK